MSGQFQTVVPANTVSKGFRQIGSVCYATVYHSQQRGDEMQVFKAGRPTAVDADARRKSPRMRFQRREFVLVERSTGKVDLEFQVRVGKTS